VTTSISTSAAMSAALLPGPAVRAATAATYAAFVGSGFAFASWASRIPQVRDRLDLQPSTLGLVLLAIAAGSILALPLSGPVIARVGSRRTVTAMAVLLGSGLLTVAVGLPFGLVPVLVGLFLLGFANGAWDVAMNVQGAVVERHLGRSIMSRFHAGFSVGTVAGAMVGAGMVALGVSVTAHLAAVAVLTAVFVPLGARGFLADQDPADGADPADPADPAGQAGPAGDPAATDGRSTWAAWREPRTLLIGLFVLAFAFAEGTGNDWISVAVIDGYHLPPALGNLAFAASWRR
jgi:MFS family permease